MLPSSTVENYLKAIVLAQLAGEKVVPMGRIAAAVGVTPGTATTMIKALGEAGLVEYEPYTGVRLTTAGEKLAGLVLRRHRLVELFLVEVMQIPWDQVHEEAEQLEHVVSERLIERMDEMLGHPQVDPHGDPIPDSDGLIARRELKTLLECPLETSVTIRRVVDQDAAFLRFVEQNNLKPGQPAVVEARDAAADSVRVRGAGDRPVTIGARAASKLLVEVVSVLLCWLFASSIPVEAQAPARSTGSNRPFEILDNSFLVEEAFNQDAGVVQSIFGVVHTWSGDWAATFTQEWPVPGRRHQLSYALTLAHPNEPARFSDVAINYRLQVVAGEKGGVAFAPRASLLLHTDRRVGGDVGRIGMQFNLPFSRQYGDVFLHANAGLTIYPKVRLEVPSLLPVVSHTHALASPFVAGSVIWRTKPMLHLMLESAAAFTDTVIAPDATSHDRSIVVSPGFRTGWNRGDQQIVVGLAAPVTRADSRTSTGFIVYGSYELPFWR
jgi:DtxR family transcriptional regulator, Mn-dependent transcriptional regulator